MSSFENQLLEVPQHSRWHLFTGTIVLGSGFYGFALAIAWLLA